jgi:hypothetical protein
MGIPGNEQTDEVAKEALDDDKQQNEEYHPKDLEKWIKTEMTKIRKKRWRNESNNMKRRKIEHEYDGDTRGMTRKEKVVISRLRTEYKRATHGPRTYSRLRPMGLHRNWTDQKRDDDDTGNMDKRSRRNEKDHRIYKKNWLLWRNMKNRRKKKT